MFVNKAETCQLLQKAYPILKIILLCVGADDRQAWQDSGATFIHKVAPPAEVLAVLEPLLKKVDSERKKP
jgi:hypothetical protein